jgi:HTH-type transcriptional regulator/antitoxin HigA
MNIKPLRTAQEYEHAVARIEDLFDAQAGSPAFDELEVLGTLVDAYEMRHFPIDFADPVEAIKFRMEQLGLERKDLEPYLGSRARVSEILNRKRRLTLPMIRALYKHLNVPVECLVQQV